MVECLDDCLWHASSRDSPLAAQTLNLAYMTLHRSKDAFEPLKTMGFRYFVVFLCIMVVALEAAAPLAEATMFHQRDFFFRQANWHQDLRMSDWTSWGNIHGASQLKAKAEGIQMQKEPSLSLLSLRITFLREASPAAALKQHKAEFPCVYVHVHTLFIAVLLQFQWPGQCRYPDGTGRMGLMTACSFKISVKFKDTWEVIMKDQKSV